MSHRLGMLESEKGRNSGRSGTETNQQSDYRNNQHSRAPGENVEKGEIPPPASAYTVRVS